MAFTFTFRCHFLACLKRRENASKEIEKSDAELNNVSDGQMGKWANGRFYMPGAIQFARPRSVTLPQDLCARRKWKKVDGVEWHGVVADFAFEIDSTT